MCGSNASEGFNFGGFARVVREDGDETAENDD